LNEHSKIGHVTLNVRAHYFVKIYKNYTLALVYAKRGRMYLALTLISVIFALL